MNTYNPLIHRSLCDAVQESIFICACGASLDEAGRCTSLAEPEPPYGSVEWAYDHMDCDELGLSTEDEEAP